MTLKEEIYARQLYNELKTEFLGKQSFISKFLGLRSSKPQSGIDISKKEAGTQSECSVTKESRQCIIHCFDINRNDLQYKGPEFYTSFTEDGKTLATGRTFDKIKTIEAIKYWIQNKTLEELYSQFTFIDEKKRQLEKLRSKINALNPPLLEIYQNEILEEHFSSHVLRFKHENRSCKVYYYGYEANPRYIFKWDDAKLFETSTPDIKRIGNLIAKWVFDKAIPSILKKEFPEIDFGKLAVYYEKGNGIEGEFILSWDRIEDFYDEWEHSKKNEIKDLIRQMRKNGFEKTLRAGQSLYTLVLSRSRKHGLRENQDSISFSFTFIKSAMEVQIQNGETITFDKIEYNDTIEGFLKTLEQESIN